MKRREAAEILCDIRKEIPEFNKEELLEYTKWAIPNIYNSIRNKEKIYVKCKKELVDKLNEQSLKYKITKNIDCISIQYVELFDFIKKDDDNYIQVYISVYFYDNVENNIDNKSINDKYWNDIWIITYKKDTKSQRKNSNCVNCGAVMEYNKIEDMFECRYCGNTIHNKSNSIWEIIDIEIGD